MQRNSLLVVLALSGLFCLCHCAAASGGADLEEAGSTTDGGGGNTVATTTSASGSAGGEVGPGGGGPGNLVCNGQPATFADGKIPSATLHVDGNANPGGDGSKAAPYQRLTDVGAVAPGTEIIVSGEVVNDAILTFTGTAAAPIWIRGTAGARMLGGNSHAALRLSGASYLVVQDLELVDSPNHVLHFDYSSHLLFRRMRIHRATTACIKGSQSTHIYVEDCDIHGGGELPGGNPVSTQVLDFVGVNTGHVLRSKIHDGKHVMVMLKGGTSDLLFAFNEIYDQHSTEETAVHLGQWTNPDYFQPLDSDYEAIRIVAFANYIHDVSGPFFAFNGAKDCAGVHNTMSVSGGGQLVRYLPGKVGKDSPLTDSKNDGCRFTGNLVVGGQASGASLQTAASGLGSGNGVDHNVWFKPGALNWYSALPQELAGSSYDQDPQLSAGGVPANHALVQQAGASNLEEIPFSQFFERDFSGACTAHPMDFGAIEVP